MENEKRISIGKRLILGFSIAPLIMVILIVVGIIKVNSIEGSLSTINDKNSVKQRFAINFRGSVHDRAISLRDVVLNSDKNDIQVSIDEIKKLSKFYDESAISLNEVFSTTETTQEEKKLLEVIKDIEKKTLPLIEQTIGLKLKGEETQAHRSLMVEAKPEFILWLKSINAFIDFQEQLNRVEAQKSRGISSSFQSDMILLMLLSLLATSGAAYFIIRSIVKPLADISQDIDHSSTNISAVANNISRLSTSLSDGVSEQSSAIEQISSSVEELNSVVQKNAEYSQSAAQIASESKLSAENGELAVKEMIEAIGEINQSNQSIMTKIDESNNQISEIVNVIAEIGKKTNVINDIVFQTKLLSFNASVEAARAGEQGKGFAVVAQEIGNLAQMSGSAAKEISEMLTASSLKVEKIVKDTDSQVTFLINEGKAKLESGNRVAKKCSEVLGEIVSKVSSVTVMANEISTSTKEQSIGFDQITKNVASMDQIIRNNSQLAKETNQTLDSLNTEADEMRKAYGNLFTMIKGNK